MANYKYLDVDKLQKRQYQLTDADEIVQKVKIDHNCGLVYPTGTGKTIVAFMVMDYFLAKGKVLFLAHSNALCSQHHREARRLFNLEPSEIEILVGDTPAKNRRDIWLNSKIIVATPQTVVSEMEKMNITFEGISFIVFDEMHMADKKYAYVYLAQFAREKGIKVLGLTASSGDSVKIDRLEKNYNITWWLYRGSDDKNIHKFVYPKKERPIVIDYPKLHTVAMSLLRKKIVQIHNDLAKITKILPILEIESEADYYSRLPFLRITELTAMRTKLRDWIDEQQRIEAGNILFELQNYGQTYTERKSKFYWYSLHVLWASYTKLMHLLNLFVTENYETAIAYINKLEEDLIDFNANTDKPPYYKYNTSFEILLDENIARFIKALIYFQEQKINHPKVDEFLQLIKKHLQTGDKILVFSNIKESLDVLLQKLWEIGVEDVEVVAGKKFMTAKKREQILKDFRQDKFKVLLATTAVEAGIDVPKIDVVINYSMPLTGIAQIQRGGRAGRTAVGLVYYLIMENSNDSSLFYSARANIAKMKKQLELRLKIQAEQLSKDFLDGFRAKQLNLSFVLFHSQKIGKRKQIVRKNINPQEVVQLELSLGGINE